MRPGKGGNVFCVGDVERGFGRIGGGVRDVPNQPIGLMLVNMFARLGGRVGSPSKQLGWSYHAPPSPSLVLYGPSEKMKSVPHTI